MRASLVCCKNVSKVGRASWGKCSLRVRIRVVSRIKYYKNIHTPRHPTWFPYYRSTAFSTQIFRDLLTVRLFHRVLGADDAPFGPVMGKRGAGAVVGTVATSAGSASSGAPTV